MAARGIVSEEALGQVFVTPLTSGSFHLPEERHRRRAAWQVGIESVRGGREPAAASRIIQLESGALATSDDTRRFVRWGRVLLGHILDPRTGWPVIDAPASVTVAAETCIQAGVFATFAMLEGPDAEVFLRRECVRHWVTRVQ